MAFGRKAKQEPKAAEAKACEANATESPEAAEARRIIARGRRLEKLSAEAGMWRAFVTGCEPEREIREDRSMAMSYAMAGIHMAPALHVWLDADTAPMWRDFANRMAEERERRLREILCECK
jgi:hypothetical protein